jgi:MurNAc alpha-1-phosphate uridylyltransferase
MLSVAILCGGLGTRMRPLTDAIPKALIPVAGEPFIAHLLRLLAARGVRDVVLCVSHLGEMIEEFVSDGTAFGVSARFSYDGPERVGTAGAVRRALPLLGERFLLTYGDSYLPIDYAAVETAFARSGRAMLMTVWRNRNELAPSNIAMDGGRIVAYRKGAADPGFEYIDYGVGAFRRDDFDALPADVPIDLAEIVRRSISHDDIEPYEVFERFYEIGSPEGLAETERYLRSHPIAARTEEHR